MLKKIFIVFAFALVTQLIAGCVDCNCGPTKKIYYTKKNPSLKHMDAALPHPMITKDSVIASDKYGIYLQMQTQQLIVRKQHTNWGLIQIAQACGCAEDEIIPTEQISAIAIFSNSDFDASHPKNTDLSLYFKVKRGKTVETMEFYLKYLKDSRYGSNNPFAEGILLQVAPSSNKKHKFKVRITLSDGRILEAETTEVELI